MPARLWFVVFALLWTIDLAHAQPASPPAIYREPLPTSSSAFSDSVGATPAQFRVDESGSASYSIPIAVPPGTAGLSPKLSLDYASKGAYGPLGQGWMIGGQSTITRCRKTIEDGDGAAALGNTINFDGNPNNDAYCLDGQRLIPRGTGLGECPSGGVGGQQFALMLDTATRICAYASTAEDVGYTSWLVFPKDGTIRRYGREGNSTLALAIANVPNAAQRTLTWALDRIADSTGNTIDFEYLRNEAQGELYLSSVRYTGKANIANPYAQTTITSPYNHIDFIYQDWPQAEQGREDYLAGAKIALTKRLQQVEVHATRNNGATPDAVSEVRRYVLGYGAATTGSALSRLVAVQECAPNGAGGLVCYPPTRMDWNYGQDARGYAHVNPDTYQNYAKSLTFAVDYKIGDINGDGLQDVVFIKDRSCAADDNVGSGSSTRFPFLIAQGKFSGIAAPTLTTTYAMRQLPNGVGIPDCDSAGPATAFDNFESLNWPTLWHLFDFTGDGREDLLLATAAGWRVFPAINSGGAWTFSTIGIDPGIGAQLTDDSRFADYDGDGLPDLWHATPGNSLEFSIRFLRRTTGNAALAYQFEASDVGVQIQVPEAVTEITLPSIDRDSLQNVDIDGDGRADLVVKVVEETFPQRSAGNKTYRARPAVADSPFVAAQGSSGVCQEPPCPVYRTYWHALLNRGVQNGGSYLFQADTAFGEAGLTVGQLSTHGAAVQLVDLNGDSLADALIQRVSSVNGSTTRQFEYRLNTGIDVAGQRFAAAQSTGLNLPTPMAARLVTADINGDRRTDLVYPVDNGSGSSTRYPLMAKLWRANDFGPEIVATGGGNDLTTIAQQNPAEFLTLFLDYDGTGTPDLVRYRANGTTSNNLYVDIGASPFGGNDFITKITNGLGAQTQVQYWPMVYSSVYTRDFDGPSRVWGRGSPVMDVYAPLWVVRQVDTSAPTFGDAGNTTAGPDALTTVRYSYQGARLQGGGRGFLGFRKIITQDLQNFLLTTTEYRQDYPFIGRPLHTAVERFASAGTDPCAGGGASTGCVIEPPINCGPLGCSVAPTEHALTTRMGTGQVLTDANSTWASIPAFNAGSVEPIFIYAATSDEQKFDLETAGAFLQGVVSSFTYDAFGNLLTATVTTSQDNGAGSPVALQTQVTQNVYGCTLAPVTVSGCANSGNLNSEWQRLGRLSLATVTHHRAGETSVVRRSSFEYDTTSKLLIAEVQGPYTDLEPNAAERERLELRTDYVLDANGNKTLEVKCSIADYANRVACLNLSAFQQRQWEADPTRVQRYIRYEYDAKGRFVTGVRTPFHGGNGATFETYAERPGITAAGALDRNAFGDPLTSLNAHGVAVEQRYGFLGRANFSRSGTGSFGRTQYAWCTDAATTAWIDGTPGIPAGAPRVNCPVGAVYRVEGDATATQAPQTGIAAAPRTFAYFDRLGREVLTTTRMYQSTETDPGAINRWVSVARAYDKLGREAIVSEPYFSTDPTVSQTTSRAGTVQNAASFAISQASFDQISRTKSMSHPEQAVNGSSTSLAAYDRLRSDETNPRGFTQKTVKNALGELISATSAATEELDPNSTFTIEYVHDAIGNLRQVKRTPSNGSSAGQLITTTVSYDRLGRKIGMNDPDKGIWIYRYNALGEQIEQTDAKGQTQRLYYDALGRVWKRTEERLIAGTLNPEPTSLWDFDTALLASGPSRAIGLIKHESNDAGFSRVVEYDSLGRPARVRTTLDNTTYYQRQTYDAFGRGYQAFDANPGSDGIEGTLVDYSTDGYPIRTREAANGTTGTIYSEVLALSQRGQVRRERLAGTNNLMIDRSYDDQTGRLLQLSTGLNGDGTYQHWTYTYDKHGDLTSRWNLAGPVGNQFDLKEDFTYDRLDRLDKVILTRFNGLVTNTVSLDVNYDQLGNIISKSGLGSYVYRSTPAGCAQAGPHAVSQLGAKNFCYDANGNQTATYVSGVAVRTINYTGFDLPADIHRHENGIVADEAFVYAPDRSYWKRIDNGGSEVVTPCTTATRPEVIFCDGLEGNGAVSTSKGTTTYYVGNVEFITRAGVAEVKRNIGGYLVITKRANTTTHEYLLRDGLGSIDAVIPIVGATVQMASIQRMSFNAHGQRRYLDPATPSTLWGLMPASVAANFDTARTTKGYTGHQQLDGVGLVHFGGRLYDPELGRFVQADPMVEDEATQGLNRYSYVLNNPLTLTDATGYLSGRQWIGLVVGAVAAVITQQYWAIDKLAAAFATAAVGGFTSGYIASGSTRSGLWGAVSAVAFLAVASAFSQVGLSPETGEIVREASGSSMARVAAHAAVGGTLDELQGGNFGSGFLSAGVTKLLTPALESVGDETFAGLLGRTILNASIGGIVNEATGGSFGNGATTGAFQYLFNQAATQSLVGCDEMCEISRMRGAQGAATTRAARALSMLGDVVEAFEPLPGGKIKLGKRIFSIAEKGADLLKGYKSYKALRRALGPAGKGRDWHHIVEKRNGKIFGEERVNNVNNIVNIDADLHQKVSNFYSSKQSFITGSDLTVRQWLDGKSYEEQYNFGLEAIKNVSTGVWK